MTLKKFILKLKNLLMIRTHERTFSGRLKYLYFKQPENKSLIVLFTGFTDNDKVRKYNYVKGLSGLKSYDRLYVNDNFGYRGSYNLFEHGTNAPELMTKDLIVSILAKKDYDSLYFAGSSKGGTCALYFGLEFAATAVFAGACQYNLGTYLSKDTRKKVFLEMMGRNTNDEDIAELNNVMPAMLKKHQGCNTVVHVVYSKKDKTYERQLVDMLSELEHDGYTVVEKEETYEKHADIGVPFLKYMLNYFTETQNGTTAF